VPDDPRTFRAHLAIIFASRTVLNTAHRIIYPFLPSIARGLGISLTAASGLVTVRLVAGLVAPILGPLVDRQPRRRTMEIALLLFSFASLLLTAAGTFGGGGLAVAVVASTLAFALYGLVKVLYDPAVHAYLGDSVPYHRRGRAIGIVELSWSSAWLLGVPATGFLIESLGWRAPWALLAGLGLLGLGLTHARLPLHPPPVRPQKDRPLVRSLVRQWRDLLRRRHVVVLLLTSLLLTMALEMPFIVYGAWLESSFGLSLSALGLASIVVGLAEAAAELGTTLLTDRLGKRRSVLIGLLGMAASLVLLPGVARLGLWAALGGVALVILGFEFAIVSLLPLATELVPEARASLLSLNVTAFSLGRIAGAVTGGWLWEWQLKSIGLHAAAGAACALAAAFLMFRGMTEIEEQPSYADGHLNT
jgi:predicted MFS family arabinose efflux permease